MGTHGGYDVFKDSKLRYLGYANEVGEAFRWVVPNNVVRLSYKVAFGYVLADTLDKTARSLWKNGPIKAVTTAGDVLIWQTLASVLIPGFTINRICHYTHICLWKIPKMSVPIARTATIGIGLASIPLIIHPIDAGVTMLMNNTYRKIF